MTKKSKKKSWGGKRPGAGRKPAGERTGEVKRPRTIRAYDSQWARWRSLADAAGLTLQEWIETRLG